MDFTNFYFFVLFLPGCFIVYYAAAPRHRNLIALMASLIFFVCGQLVYLPMMAALIGFNFVVGQRIGTQDPDRTKARWLLITAVSVNVALLLVSKWLAGWIATYGVRFMLGHGHHLPRGLTDWCIDLFSRAPFPLGISYIQFQVISYLLDVYHEGCERERSFRDFSLYILLFPKIITGPIARYMDLKAQLEERHVSGAEAANGLRRFIVGLAKKVLIADQLAKIVTPAFALGTPNYSTGTAWLVLAGFALQLYFDFSGYVDMAIGLGRMLGFRFVENFNYPYVSRSISEFWRRWHMSLSSWFRDYVFYPLEFRDRRAGRFWQKRNIMTVFLLTGLWHGLGPTYAIWGLVHGAAISLETTRFGRWLKGAWAPLQHTYALGVILLSWVFFRAPSVAFAGQFLARLAGSQSGISPVAFSLSTPLPIVDHSIVFAGVVGGIFAMPVWPRLKQMGADWRENHPGLAVPLTISSDLALLLLFVTTIAGMLASSHVASIYGRF